MEKLPQLALDLVCEYLGLSEPHKASLLAFASASRVCRAAAWRERFSQLSIDVDHPKFDEKLKILESILDETKGRACVKVLKLGVCNHDQTERVDDKAQGVHASCAKFGSNFHPKHPLRERKWKKGRRPDKFWQSLAQFISSLHLKEVIWASREQMPRCIIAALNQQIPACRLHVHGFDLHSLHQREILQDVEEMDYMLATSPCLYSICAPYSMYDESGCANYNGEAVLQLSSGFAPSLKHVCVWRASTMPSGEIRARRNARLEWRGFHPQSESEWHEIPESKGQIQSLTIDDFYMVPGSQLASWEHHVDFSVLQSLHLARQIELVVLQRLADIAEQDGLPRLKSLNLPAISCEYEELIDAESMMTRLCASLHPLVELGIVGLRTKSFEAILQRHGDALQVFCIQDFILSAHQVLQLRESCPRVRTLNIEILRSAGDHVEIEIYRTLGSLRNLKSLSVILKCTDYRHSDGLDEPVILMMPSSDEEDQEAMEIAIRQVFVNAAVDASLAQAIFQQILAAHASVKAGLPPMLDCIRLQVGTVSVLNNQMMNEDFKGVLAWIGRSWICRRDPRDTHQNDVTIEEVDRDTRLCNGKRLEDDMEELSGSEQYADVWKALWPDTAAGWKEAWQSFPLANDVETFKDTKIFINFQTGERGKES